MRDNIAKQQETMINDNLSGKVTLKVVDTNETIIPKELPIIDGKAISQAISIADRVQDESHKIWFLGSKKVVTNELKKLNRSSVYKFVGYMITTAKTQTVLGDIKKLITYDCLKHVLLSLLKMAEDCGLTDSFQFKKLKKEYFIVLNMSNSSPQRCVNRKLIEETNMYIENLYLEMNKILH